jgi:hypothetical protein
LGRLVYELALHSHCFNAKCGNIVLHERNGEYYGGHKIHLSGGKIDDYELGEFVLTNDYIVFIKYGKDPSSK